MSNPDIASQSLKGKIAVVTGASSGLGVRFSRVLAAQGAHVALCGRRVDRLESLANELEGDGARVLPVQLDVTDMHSLEQGLRVIETELGHVDILVNNAGMNVQSMAVDMTPDGYDTMMDTNLKGAFFMATGVAKKMIERGEGGRIINIASIGAHTVLPGLATYCMSKAAIAMMTRSLAHEWARHKINVNAICPGYIETELNSEWFASEGGQKQISRWPRRRLGQEEDLDGTLLLLASEQGRLLTGSVITVDDGQSL